MKINEILLEQKTHKVSQGDNLWRISQTYGVTVDDLKKWNNLSSDVIQIGQKLFVSAPSSRPTAASTADPKPSLNQTVKYLMDAFVTFGKNQGLSDELSAIIAAGFVGNLKAESTTFNPAAVGDQGKAFGIAQWRAPRRKNWETMSGLEWKSDGSQPNFEQQLEFIIIELSTRKYDHKGTDGYPATGYAHQWKKIIKATTPEQAAELVDKWYEQSSGEHREKRKAYAREFYDAYTKLID